MNEYKKLKKQVGDMNVLLIKCVKFKDSFMSQDVLNDDRTFQKLQLDAFYLEKEAREFRTLLLSRFNNYEKKK